jgi:hypothetical protein
MEYKLWQIILILMIIFIVLYGGSIMLLYFTGKKYYTSKKTKRVKWGKLLLDSLKFCALLLFASMGVFGGAGVTLNL